jgi:hypothetical protein
MPRWVKLVWRPLEEAVIHYDSGVVLAGYDRGRSPVLSWKSRSKCLKTKGICVAEGRQLGEGCGI